MTYTPLRVEVRILRAIMQTKPSIVVIVRGGSAAENAAALQAAGEVAARLAAPPETILIRDEASS